MFVIFDSQNQCSVLTGVVCLSVKSYSIFFDLNCLSFVKAIKPSSIRLVDNLDADKNIS